MPNPHDWWILDRKEIILDHFQIQFQLLFNFKIVLIKRLDRVSEYIFLLKVTASKQTAV